MFLCPQGSKPAFLRGLRVLRGKCFFTARSLKNAKDAKKDRQGIAQTMHAGDGKSDIAPLLACLRHEGEAAKIARLRGLEPADWTKIAAAAARYGVAPVLFHILKPLFSELAIPAEIRAHLQRLYFATAARNVRLYHQLSEIISKTNELEIPVILLKGAHLAEFVYGNLALRPMLDIDLLVRPDDAHALHRLLIQDGYRLEEEHQGASQVHWAPYQKAGAVRVELHYHIVQPPFARRIDVAELWQRAERRTFQGTEMRMLCPEDLLLHLAAHTCIEHEFDNGLLPYVDVCRVLDECAEALDWDRLRDRARRWGLDRCLCLMLALAEKLPGACVPQRVHSAIQSGPGFLNALGAAEAMIGDPDPGVSRFIASLFGPLSWRAKLKIFWNRSFPSRETLVVPQQPSEGAGRLQLGRLYGRRLGVLWRKFAKTVWLGLTRDPRTVSALQKENRKNDLRHWLVG
jgi:hypothetical protein